MAKNYRKHKAKGIAQRPNQYARNHKTIHTHGRFKDKEAWAEAVAKSEHGPRPNCRHCHGTAFAGVQTRILPKNLKATSILACCCLVKTPTAAMLRATQRKAQSESVS